MKKIIYILAFGLLGFIVQILLHAGIEMLAIYVLTLDFETYCLGLSWNAWFIVHHVLSIVLAIVGIGFGIQQGFYWWKRVYPHNSTRINVDNNQGTL